MFSYSGFSRHHHSNSNERRNWARRMGLLLLGWIARAMVEHRVRRSRVVRIRGAMRSRLRLVCRVSLLLSPSSIPTIPIPVTPFCLSAGI